MCETLSWKLESLSLSPTPHTTNTYTCRVIITPKMRGGAIMALLAI